MARLSKFVFARTLHVQYSAGYSSINVASTVNIGKEKAPWLFSAYATCPHFQAVRSGAWSGPFRRHVVTRWDP